MPRKPRVEAPGAIQHVTARGNAGIAIVIDDDDRRSLMAGLARVAERYEWTVHAYCLMDTHLHLVVETPQPTLGAGMKQLLGGYAFGFNQRHNRYGHLFGGRYAASLVESEAHAIELSAYVVLNPVRAGLVRNAVDWPWSNYRATAGLVKSPRFLQTRLLTAILHPDPTRARVLYRELVREVAERPRPGSG
jgi:putative transposase